MASGKTRLSFFKRIISSSLFKRYARGSMWMLLGVGGSKTFGMIGNILIARIMQKEAFGDIGIVFSTYALFQFVASASLGGTSSRYIAAYRANKAERIPGVISLTVTTALITAILSAITLFLFAPHLAAKELGSPYLTYALRMTSIVVFTTSVKAALEGALTGFEEFRAVCILSAITNFLTPACSVIGALISKTDGYFTGFAIAAIMSFAVNVLTVRKILKTHGITFEKCINSPKEWGILWSYTLPLILSGLLVMPITWYSRTLLYQLSDGRAQMGAYSAANQYLIVVSLVVSALTRSVSPILANLFGSGNIKRYLQTFFGSFAVVVTSTTGMCLLIALAGPWLMPLFGKDFRGDEIILKALCLVAVFQGMDAMINRAISSTGQQWVAFWFGVAWSVAMCFLSLWLIPFKGAVGLAFATAGAYLTRIVMSGSYISLYLLSLYKKNKVVFD